MCLLMLLLTLHSPHIPVQTQLCVYRIHHFTSHLTSLSTLLPTLHTPLPMVRLLPATKTSLSTLLRTLPTPRRQCPSRLPTLPRTLHTPTRQCPSRLPTLPRTLHTPTRRRPLPMVRPLLTTKTKVLYLWLKLAQLVISKVGRLRWMLLHLRGYVFVGTVLHSIRESGTMQSVTRPHAVTHQNASTPEMQDPTSTYILL
jgi:hypothetical protein